MRTRPRLLLLDAGAVFAALRFEAWGALVEAYEVVIPSIVVRVEAIFYVNKGGERIEIDLPREVAAGRIVEVAMAVADIEAVARRFTPDFRERVDAGELEALAYLVDDPSEDLRFVSGDGPAIQAAAMVDPDARVISLEEALAMCGQSKHLEHQFTAEFAQRHLEEGKIRRIQRRGLAD